MKKIFILLLIFICSNPCFAAKDYEKLYNEAQVPNIKLMHNLDPYQDEDYFNYAWSPYPLFRTATTLSSRFALALRQLSDLPWRSLYLPVSE